MSVISFFTFMSMIRFDFNHDDKEKDVGEKNINHAKVKKDNAQDFFDETDTANDAKVQKDTGYYAKLQKDNANDAKVKKDNANDVIDEERQCQ